MKRKAIKDLHFSEIDTKPRDFDYGSGYGETWEYTEAAECQNCGKVVCPVYGETTHSEVDTETDCEGYVNADGPMMNFFYPISGMHGINPETAAEALVNLPLCVVYMNDTEEHGLALTGGGMDLSWQICEAYMLLGYLPPVHFSDLPEMCGRGKSKRDKWIIAGCIASCRGMAQRANRQAKRLKETRKRLNERE